MDKLSLEIGGMSCGHCVAGVSKALEQLDGVEVEQVAIGSAVVRYDADAITPSAITQAVEDEGYSIVAAR
jgi:copper chaperone CopZ